MKVLVVGGGGREHALAWKLKQSPKVREIFIAPGNAGTASLGTNIPINTNGEILAWLTNNPVDLVVIGPDNFLAQGLTDSIQEIGVPVFGPTKAAAEIEWSKSYAKQFMREEGIPTASYDVFSDIDSALTYVRSAQYPLVIKADGLASGKGVVVAQNLGEAEAAVTDIMGKKVHGEAGDALVIEEYLEGFEISVHAFCDGEHAVLFPPSKDHKRIFDGDKGPNTGGMGTIAPVPTVSKHDMDVIQERIVRPTLEGLKKRGRAFRGILFPGIMLTKDGPKVIEFNARFGDPETQSYMRLLESDLFDILNSCSQGSLKGLEITWSPGFACCVVTASAGYPGPSEKGIEIHLPDEGNDTVVFHAGTEKYGDRLVTSGGRVLGVTAVGNTLKNALGVAYDSISPAIFAGAQYRKDIGASSIEVKEGRAPLLNWLFILAVLGGIYATVFYIGVEDLGVYVERAGVWGPIVLILAKIATIVVAPLGGAPLYPVAGALFGPVHGFFYMFLGDALGASAAFYISRRFGRGVAIRFVSKHGMVMVERILAYLGTSRGMLEARLYFIAFPEFISYAAGLTRIPYGTFITIHLVIYAAPIAIVVWLGDAIVGLSPLQFLLLAGAASLSVLVGAYLFYRKAKSASVDSHTQS